MLIIQALKEIEYSSPGHQGDTQEVMCRTSQPSQSLVSCCESPQIKSWPTMYPCNTCFSPPARMFLRALSSDAVLVQRFVQLEYGFRFFVSACVTVCNNFTVQQHAVCRFQLQAGDGTALPQSCALYIHGISPVLFQVRRFDALHHFSHTFSSVIYSVCAGRNYVDCSAIVTGT